MSNNVAENVLLQSDLRRRRWTIRIGLASIFILPILTVAFLLLSFPTGMTASQAVAAYSQLKLFNSREDVERVLGKPAFTYNYTDAEGNVEEKLVWQFHTPDKDNVDFFECTMRCNKQGMLQGAGSCRVVKEGWKNTLIAKWMMFKRRIGL